MTPTERAEKIKQGLFPRVQLTPLQTEYIAAQIEEAVFEAIQRTMKREEQLRAIAVQEAEREVFEEGRQLGITASRDIDYKLGWNAAREKAKGIAENVCPDENFGEDCHESIAQRIGEMEP